MLAAEEADRHRRVVLVIDEAHLLTPEQLEELRLLTNADLDSLSSFAGILVGHPHSPIGCARRSSASGRSWAHPEVARAAALLTPAPRGPSGSPPVLAAPGRAEDGL